MIAFSELRHGELTLELIENGNLDAVLAAVGPETAPEVHAHYLPRFDAEGRRVKYGFLARLRGEPAGLSLLGVSCWENLRGYTGADTLPPMRGQGIAPASKPHLFHLGFALLGLHRIETGMSVSNAASRRSIEKTPGFVFEGVLREHTRHPDGTFQDERRYAIVRGDWARLYRDLKIEVIR